MNLFIIGNFATLLLFLPPLDLLKPDDHFSYFPDDHFSYFSWVQLFKIRSFLIINKNLIIKSLFKLYKLLCFFKENDNVFGFNNKIIFFIFFENFENFI